MIDLASHMSGMCNRERSTISVTWNLTGIYIWSQKLWIWDVWDNIQGKGEFIHSSSHWRKNYRCDIIIFLFWNLTPEGSCLPCYIIMIIPQSNGLHLFLNGLVNTVYHHRLSHRHSHQDQNDFVSRRLNVLSLLSKFKCVCVLEQRIDLHKYENINHVTLI